MTYQPHAMLATDATADAHRQYSLDQIKSLISQAANIAEQESLSLLHNALTLMKQVAETCTK